MVLEFLNEISVLTSVVRFTFSCLRRLTVNNNRLFTDIAGLNRSSRSFQLNTPGILSGKLRYNNASLNSTQSIDGIYMLLAHIALVNHARTTRMSFVTVAMH